MDHGVAILLRAIELEAGHGRRVTGALRLLEHDNCVVTQPRRESLQHRFEYLAIKFVWRIDEDEVERFAALGQKLFRTLSDDRRTSCAPARHRIRILLRNLNGFLAVIDQDNGRRAPAGRFETKRTRSAKEIEHVSAVYRLSSLQGCEKSFAHAFTRRACAGGRNREGGLSREASNDASHESI